MYGAPGPLDCWSAPYRLKSNFAYTLESFAMEVLGSSIARPVACTCFRLGPWAQRVAQAGSKAGADSGEWYNPARR